MKVGQQRNRKCPEINIQNVNLKQKWKQILPLEILTGLHYFEIKRLIPFHRLLSKLQEQNFVTHILRAKCKKCNRRMYKTGRKSTHEGWFGLFNLGGKNLADKAGLL